MKYQFFYDYECPFCKKGYETLMDLLPSYPEAEIEWRPVEAHPRPEPSHPHTDLCIRAFYIAEELGADIDAFNRKLFRAVVVERKNVEKQEILADLLEDILDREKFLEMLRSGKYASKVKENNDLAYEKNGIWYVPAFRLPLNDSKNAPRLNARGGIGISREEMKTFLEKKTK